MQMAVARVLSIYVSFVAKRRTGSLLKARILSPPKSGANRDGTDPSSLHPTAQRLVDHTLDVINATGVQGVHVTEVLEATGVSVGSFYHHFANREELLRITLESRFIQMLQSEISRFAMQVNNVTTTSELVTTFARRQTLYFSDPTTRLERHRRVEILGYALSSVRALADVTNIQANALSGLRSVLRSVQERGLIRQDADIDQFSSWFTGMQLGRVLADIHPIRQDQDASWIACCVRAIVELLAPEGTPVDFDEILPGQEDIESLETPENAHSLTHWPERWVPLHKLHPTARTLIEATMRSLDEVGEEGLRVEQILHESGISVGSLYHHFHDREGLLIAADTQRFVSAAPNSIDSWVFAAERATTSEEFLELVRSIVVHSADNENGPLYRRRQLQVLSTALTRPKLMENIVNAQRYVVTYIARIFERAKLRGLIRQDLDPEVYVLWLIGTQFGKVVSELIPMDTTDWTEIAQRAACAPLRLDVHS